MPAEATWHGLVAARNRHKLTEETAVNLLKLGFTDQSRPLARSAQAMGRRLPGEPGLHAQRVLRRNGYRTAARPAREEHHMITRAQALTANRFHEEGERRTDGSCYVWRRNGATQTWKTRPEDFRTPIKYGLKNYGQLTPAVASRFHAEEDCPYGNTW